MATPTPTSIALATVTFTATHTLTGTNGFLYSTSLAAAATKAASQTILSPPHADPTKVNPSNPLVLFIIQTFVIVGFSRMLGLGLAKIRQPHVISEVLGGIILGPTAFGRIPGFTNHIFPPASIPYLTLISDIGLIFFLFLVGLEVDFVFFRKNLKAALSVAGAGMAIPFALGCAVSVGLYKEFITQSTPFPHFLLFIGTSMSITAFPVLARILTELDLVSDKALAADICLVECQLMFCNTVGIIVLASGVLNDVTGWILLALSVALANASSGIVVLYIILCAIGWTFILWFIARPIFSYLARRSGSLDGNGPTQSIVCLALMLVLVSAWVTDQIGVNAIFGGFLVGLILPREKSFAHHLTEKIEDVVTTLFVPIYFATSGLKTNLGLLDNGITWAWTICVISVAFCGKFIGCAIAARSCGFTFRESGAVGSLMSCKGLIELIVLNIGLSAGIISPRVFAIYVLEALLLTFASTPLALAFYPPRLRHPAVSPKDESLASTGLPHGGIGGGLRPRVLVVLERLENLSPAMVFTKLLAQPPTVVDRLSSTAMLPSSSASSNEKPPRESPSPAESTGPIIDTVRLVELSDRTSALMHASEMEESLRNDPVNALYSTFTSLNAIAINSSLLEVAPQERYAEKVAHRAVEKESDLVLIPWRLTKSNEEGFAATKLTNPLESLFDKAGGGRQNSSPQYASFVRDLFIESATDVGLFIERGSPLPVGTTTTHLFLAFHGGADDRTALEFVLQLVQSNPTIGATIVRVVRAAEPTEEDGVQDLGTAVSAVETGHQAQVTIGGGGRGVDTLYATGDHLASESADDIALEEAKILVTNSNLPLMLEICHTAFPLKASVARGKRVEESHPGCRNICIVGRGRRDAASHRKENAELLASKSNAELGICRSSDVRRCVGEVGTSMLVHGVGRFVLIIQSRLTAGRKEQT